MDPGCLTPSPSSTGVFTKDQAAAFYKDLKLHFIGFLVFPRVFLNNPNFSLKIGQVPPVMDPTIAGDVLFDTECEVSTQLVKPALYDWPYLFTRNSPGIKSLFKIFLMCCKTKGAFT